MTFRRFALFVLGLLALGSSPVHAGRIETNVTFSSYWISNYNYNHSTSYTKLWGNTGTDAPDQTFVGWFRSDFLGPLTKKVDWNHVTHRELMSVRGMSWGMVDFGDGTNGGPNGAWAYNVKRGRYRPISGIWFLYIDRDITPGSYPKIQLMPQTRPANWYRGYKQSYYQVPFPVMADDREHFKTVANNDWLPTGTVFTVSKLGTNVHSVPGMDAFLQHNNFEVLDIGVSGRGFDVHQGLQYFEAEDMDKYSLWMPGSQQGDTRGATINILGQFKPDGTFIWFDRHGNPGAVGAPPPTRND